MCEECGCPSGVDMVVLRVEGMTCSHCKNAVEKAVKALPGVSSAEATLDDHTVTINFDSDVFNLDTMKKAIIDAGYRVV